MKTRVTVLLLMALIQGCAGGALTAEQRARQDQVDAIVAGALFENDLDTQAAYNIGADGYVKINFHPSAKPEAYDVAVRQIRSHPAVKGVYAEQSGGEVCAIKALAR